MSGNRKLTALGSVMVMLAVPSASVAQDTVGEPAMDGTEVVVRAVEYAFADLPTSVPLGTELRLANDGVEVHEMVLMRISDDVTASLEELGAWSDEGRDLMAEGVIELVGGEWRPLVAVPGAFSEDTWAMDQEGRYIAFCTLPQGLEYATLVELGFESWMLAPDADPASIPAEAQAFYEEVSGNTAHNDLGMVEEFVVTAEGTDVGQAPESAPDA